MITPKTLHAGEDTKKLNHLYVADENENGTDTQKQFGSFLKKKVCNYHYVAIALLGICPREKKICNVHTNT